MLTRIELIERAVELFQKIGDAIEQCFVEKMQTPGDFLIDRWFLQAQFPGHPKQRNLVTQFIDESGPFPRRPSRLFHLDQHPEMRRCFSRTVTRFASVGWAVMTGLMRVEARRPCTSCAPAPRFAASAMRLANVPCDRGFTAHALSLAAQPHSGMLFDDRKQLEPNSMRLENASEHFRRKIPGLGFSPKDRRDLRMLAVHHVCQQLEQYVRGFLAVECSLNASRRVAGLNPLAACPIPRHELSPRQPDARFLVLRNLMKRQWKMSISLR